MSILSEVFQKRQQTYQYLEAADQNILGHFCSNFSVLYGKLTAGSLVLVNYAEENTVKEEEY